VLWPDRHPVQIGAVSVAAADDGRRWYVQNWASNTITVIPAEGMVDAAGAVLRQPWQSTIDPGKLQTYRDNVALAFLKMAGRFLQYLKDCFCELLLVKCPEEIGKIYLADVSFKDDKVYQICNFHRRHYVHSFRTIEYWMSVIPILPVLKFGVEALCCSVITGFFDKLSAPRSNSIRISRTRSGLQWVSALNLASAVTTQRSQVGTAAALVRTALNERLARPPAGTHPAEVKGISNSEVVGATTDAVAENAARKDVTVEEVVVTDSGTTAAATLATSALKAGRIAPGSRIRLIADKSGRVLGYEAMDTAPKIDAARTDSARKAAARGTGKPPRITPQPGAAPADTSAAAPGAPVPEVTRADLKALRAEVAKLRATPAPAAPTAAAPAPEITKADVESLRAEVAKLRATPAPAAPAAPTVSKEDFDRMQADLASVRAELAALKARPPVR
jgi:BMFP domain-containing protein YqiC